MYLPVLSLSNVRVSDTTSNSTFCDIMTPLFTSSFTITLLYLSVFNKEQRKDSFGGVADCVFLMILLIGQPVVAILGAVINNF